MKVITYQSPRGHKMNVTPDQIKRMEEAEVWPKDATGQEYCSVSHGLHNGEPVSWDWLEQQTESALI